MTSRQEDRDEQLSVLRKPEAVPAQSPIESMVGGNTGLSWSAFRAAWRARRIVESHRQLFEAATQLRKVQRLYALETGRLENVSAEIDAER